jgi:putative ABC transport system substrate-binding protein
MRRRDVLSLATGVAAYPLLAAHAQQPRLPVVGILAAASPENMGAQRNLAALRAGLAEAGFVEGQTVAFEYRWANTEYARLPELAAELVNRKVDVIVTEGGDPSTWAAKRATTTIPIVFHVDHDPVAAGLVASFARPGGNLTGISLHDLDGKRIELIMELLPHVKTIAFLVNPKSTGAEGAMGSTRQAAHAKGLLLHVVTAADKAGLDAAFATLAQLHPDALAVMGDTLFSGHVDELTTQVARLHMPAIYPGQFFVEHGGLLSYGSYFVPMYRRKGIIAAKILKGANPAELPIERPDKFQLFINLKTANALGLTVPPALLARADEVIE